MNSHDLLGKAEGTFLLRLNNYEVDTQTILFTETIPSHSMFIFDKANLLYKQIQTKQLNFASVFLPTLYISK